MIVKSNTTLLLLLSTCLLNLLPSVHAGSNRESRLDHDGVTSVFLDDKNYVTGSKPARRIKKKEKTKLTKNKPYDGEVDKGGKFPKSKGGKSPKSQGTKSPKSKGGKSPKSKGKSPKSKGKSRSKSKGADLCDVCMEDEAYLIGTVEECLESCEDAEAVATYLTGGSSSTSELSVVSCSVDTVEVQGDFADSLEADSFFIYLDGANSIECIDCLPLFRKIESVEDGTNGSRILQTSFATVQEIFGDEYFDPSVANEEVEPLFGCTHSTSRNRKLWKGESEHAMAKDNTEIEQLLSRNLLGECRGNWLQKNSDGRCTYTDCFVGTDGSADDCFVCKTSCDNGCGGEGSVFNTDGDFLIFDFGPACCNHDHCWSSTVSRSSCDRTFFSTMIGECPTIPLFLRIFLPTPIQGVLAACPALATAFYGFVASPLGTGFYQDAQADQKAYEETPVCVAQCPSTQQSGGQGTTVLRIDLLKTSGTFPVSYQMYSIPDRLFVTYEGMTIYDTGGLVSGSQTVQVTYSGMSTVVEVTLDAPNAGTAWDVTVGCPP